MFERIKCCSADCEETSLLGDGLLSGAGHKETNAIPSLASSLGWFECDHSTPEKLCFRCPSHRKLEPTGS